MHKIIAVMAALLFTNAAQADITATYAGMSRQIRTFEVAQSGDARYGQRAISGVNDPIDHYFLRRAGRDFMITSRGGNARVLDADDVMAAAQTQMASCRAGHPEAAKAEADKFKIVEHGTWSIGDRTGAAFYLEIAGQIVPRPAIVGHSIPEKIVPMPWLVMSQDADLAPLGTAVAELSDNPAMLVTLAAGAPSLFDRIQAILRSGTPLVFMGEPLSQLDRQPIASARFKVPAPPRPREEVVKFVGVGCVALAG